MRGREDVEGEERKIRGRTFMSSTSGSYTQCVVHTMCGTHYVFLSTTVHYTCCVPVGTELK